MNLVSIVVPVYNVESYIDKCIESLVNQSLKHIEIILVDDGSTDKSGHICDKYALSDNRIRVIHKINGGLSDARNEGIKVAKGKYISFVDSDDWISINMIESLYNLAESNDADIVQCDYIETYNEKETNETVDSNISTQCYNGIQMLEYMHTDKYGKCIVVWNKLYKKELFEEILFPKGKIHDDEFTTYKLFNIAKRIVDTDSIMYYYRQREGSIINSEFNIGRLDKIEALQERNIYFEVNNLYELSRKTESNICGQLKGGYIGVRGSDIKNKEILLKNLKKEMINNYSKFIRNKHISLKGKITLTVCILNGELYYKLYSKFEKFK